MGLWLKCPKCQASNPLSLKACAACGASLDNLPEKQRTYVLTSAGAPPPQPKAAAQPAKKAAKEPAKGKAAKSAKAEAPPKTTGDVVEDLDLTKPPAKKAKGPKAVKKKQK
jgi:hypothetical protein